MTVRRSRLRRIARNVALEMAFAGLVFAPAVPLEFARHILSERAGAQSPNRDDDPWWDTNDDPWPVSEARP